LRVLEFVHNEAKICLLNICPDKILVSQVGEEVDEIQPYFYDLSSAVELSEGDQYIAQILSSFN
jgi:hypothetical protein